MARVIGVERRSSGFGGELEEGCWVWMVIHPTSRGGRWLTAEVYLVLLEDTCLLCFLWIRTGKISLQVPKSSTHSVRIQRRTHPIFHRPKLIHPILEHTLGLNSPSLSRTAHILGYLRLGLGHWRTWSTFYSPSLGTTSTTPTSTLGWYAARCFYCFPWCSSSSRVHEGFSALYLSTQCCVS